MRNDNPGETQLLRLQDTLLNTVDRTDLSGQAYLSGHTNTRLDADIQARGKDGTDYRQIDSRIIHFQTSGDIQENIFLDQLKTRPFLQYRQ